MFKEEAAEVAKKLGYNADSVGCELIRQALLAAYENGKAFQQGVQRTCAKCGASTWANAIEVGGKEICTVCGASR